MAKKNKLNIFLSNLAVLNVKIHNLHWNVVGPEFILIHQFTEKLYKMFQEQFDTVAEVMKMQGEMPLVSLADYLENATVPELEGREYTVPEVLENLSADCQTIIDLAMDIRDEADKQDNFQIVNLFEEYLETFFKYAWIMDAMLKIEPEEEEQEKEDKKSK